MALVLTDSVREAAAASRTFAILLGVAVMTPLLGLPQLFTGTIVNAVLLASVVLLGPRAAVTLGVLPSLFAVVSGQLPAAMVPVVPLIMLGNTLLVLVFHALRSRGWWLALVPAALAKSLWLLGATHLLVAATDLLPAPAVPLALAMMSWPQLVTALTGGVIAYAVLRPASRL